ncbi:MAG: hypothetical protein V2A62_01320 [Candidatus Woesearchaeota archaeon]
MELLEKTILIIILAVGVYLLVRFFQKIFYQSLKRKISLKPLFLFAKIKAKADRKFNKLLAKFKREHPRKATQNDLFRIIINASHITIRRRGRGGHWGRQKVRKYLLEKHHVVDQYKMR